MRIKTMPKLSGSSSAFSGSNWAEWSVVAGRLMCDTYLSARELLPSQRSYALKELAMTQLSKPR
jgi:DNA polymerase alpha subunit A